jgi:hypothetical protein
VFDSCTAGEDGIFTSLVGTWYKENQTLPSIASTGVATSTPETQPDILSLMIL